jgi:hypothetical protein
MPTAQVESQQATAEMLCLTKEYKLTFQAAILGSDGLLVVSDRMMTICTPVPGKNFALQMRQAFKFIESEDKNQSLVCAFAGSQFSRDIAQKIVLQCLPSNFVSTLEWEVSLNALIVNYVRPELPILDEIIIVRKDTPGAVWVAQKGVLPVVSKIIDCVYTGDNVPARFLIGHFWEQKPVSELRALALLSLHYACSEDPSSIGGAFDLMTLKDGHVEWETFDPKNIANGPMCSEFDRRMKTLLLDISKLPLV